MIKVHKQKRPVAGAFLFEDYLRFFAVFFATFFLATFLVAFFATFFVAFLATFFFAAAIYLYKIDMTDKSTHSRTKNLIVRKNFSCVNVLYVLLLVN